MSGDKRRWSSNSRHTAGKKSRRDNAADGWHQQQRRREWQQRRRQRQQCPAAAHAAPDATLQELQFVLPAQSDDRAAHVLGRVAHGLGGHAHVAGSADVSLRVLHLAAQGLLVPGQPEPQEYRPLCASSGDGERARGGRGVRGGGLGTATKEEEEEDVSRKARWIIITTAVSLFVMSVLLVGIMLRLAPVIDDLGE
nr:uncharacterized protein LOC119172820 [Rhipicephalus microplus]